MTIIDPNPVRPKLLVVDDEKNNLDFVARVFRPNFEVLTAESGAAGLELLRQHPDVAMVISDQRMPGMSGAEFLAEVIKNAPDAVRVLLTGYADHESVVDAVNLGKIWSYVQKPVTPDQLREVARSSLEVYHLTIKNRQLQRELEQRNRELEEQKRLLALTLDERTHELIEANRVLADMAIRDGLTGLYNHRYFQDRTEQELSRARRYKSQVSLVLLDIDSFKLFNDTYGHQLGDRLLRELAELLSANTRLEDMKARVRDTDLVARYGGEEFVVLMPETPKAGAMLAAERLRASIAAHPFAGRDAQPEARVTVSMGVATFPTDAESRETLIGHADRALYEAKRHGRNRVVSA